MALIDKETIRKEIEFAKSVYSNPKRVVHGVADAFRQDGRAAMCDDILKFLDTLPEQPVPTIMTNEMLMGEIKPKKKSNALFDKCVENCDPAVMKEVSDNVNKMLGKQPVEGLEEKDFVEEVRQYYSNNCTWDALKQPMLSIITRCARHFAEWGAEHLKK